MLLNPASPTRRVLIATIVIAMIYSIVREFGVQRELTQIAFATEQQTSGMAILQMQLRTQFAPLSNSTIRLASDSIAMDDVNVPIDTLAQGSTTLVQAFAEVLDIFNSRGVICIAVDPKEAPSSGQRTSRSILQITLTGEFQHMLEALELIHARQPRAMVVGLSMRRPKAAEPCIWELAFCFSEMPL